MYIILKPTRQSQLEYRIICLSRYVLTFASARECSNISIFLLILFFLPPSPCTYQENMTLPRYKSAVFRTWSTFCKRSVRGTWHGKLRMTSTAGMSSTETMTSNSNFLSRNTTSSEMSFDSRFVHVILHDCILHDMVLSVQGYVDASPKKIYRILVKEAERMPEWNPMLTLMKVTCYFAHY